MTSRLPPRASPLDRRPGDRESILDNEIVLDREEFNRVIWGLHYRKADAFPGLAAKVWRISATPLPPGAVSCAAKVPE